MASDEALHRTLLLLVAIVLLVPVVMALIMVPAMGLWGWDHMGTGPMWGNGQGSWLWPLTWLLVVAVAVAVGWLLFRGGRLSGGFGTDPALRELRLAYARGDLSHEEFEERRERLEREG